MHHFETREALLVEAVTHLALRLADRTLDRIDLAALRTPEQREAVLDEAWREFTSPQALAAAQLWVAAWTEPELAPTLRELEERLGAIIVATTTALFPEQAGDPRVPGADRRRRVADPRARHGDPDLGRRGRRHPLGGDQADPARGGVPAARRAVVRGLTAARSSRARVPFLGESDLGRIPPRRSPMDLYVILRRCGWRSVAELEEAAARSATVGDGKMSDDIRWIRSYVTDEGGGVVGTVCIYEATSPEKIREHAMLSGLPADEIVPIIDTVILRPDPAPAG